MGYVLRIINKSTLWETHKDYQHLIKANDTPADPLGDLRTLDNSLSFFFLDDDNHCLNRAITAWSANRQTLDKCDYLLIENHSFANFINGQELAVVEEAGDLPDEVVNGWHRNLKNLSSVKLQRLCFFLYMNAKPNSFPKAIVKRMINDSRRSNSLNEKKMRSRLIDELNKQVSH